VQVLKIQFIDAGGTAHVVDAVIDQSVMDAAVNHDIDGIDAECGGEMACGTCHVHVDEMWLGKLAEQSDDEREAIETLVTGPVVPQSRLSCQIKVAEGLDGLSVVVPAS
jgi:2Fe-2S ferredoxin